MQLLRRSSDIPNGIGLPALFAIFQGGKVSRGVEEPSITLADETGLFFQLRTSGEKDTDSTFADLGNFLGKKPVNQGGECIIVKTLPQTLIKGDAKHSVESLELLPGKSHRLIPDAEVLHVTLLEFHQLVADGLLDCRVGLLKGINLAVEADEFGDRGLLKGLLVEEVLPAVDDFSELGAPVTDVIIGDDLMAEMTGDARKGITKDGAADMADMHRLGDIR